MIFLGIDLYVKPGASWSIGNVGSTGPWLRGDVTNSQSDATYRKEIVGEVMLLY